MRMANAVVVAAVLCSTWLSGTDRAFSAGEQVASLSGITDERLKVLKENFRRPASIPFPEENSYTPEKVALGKLLYYDTRLSGSNLLSCASCHNPGFGWSDGQPRAIGHEMRVLGRRTPTILDVAWGELYFWDGRAGTLEEQALGPIQAAGEMNQELDALVSELSVIRGYVDLFDAAFPGEGITPDAIAKAIATYERTVVSSRAPFDDWIDGDEDAIPENAKRGFVIFNTKGNCAACHAGWSMTDHSFHDIGLPDTDIGRGKQLAEIVKMQHAFKTPGLRDISRRQPYMHDGSMATLEEVIDHYINGGTPRASRSEEMKPLAMTGEERADLLAFLHTLTGPLNPVVLPVLPR